MTRLLCVLLPIFLFQTAFAFQKINAFVYHRFGDDRYPSINMDLDRFEAHLKYLKDNNYELVTISEAMKILGNKKPSKEKLAAITVDDAYKSFYQNGLPLLKKYGFNATLYVNTGTVGAGDYMTWHQLIDAQDQGIEIGNHSHSHEYFLNLNPQEFAIDLIESEKEFLINLRKQPRSFAYPYGEWNEEMAYILDTAGYTSAAAQNSGVIDAQSNPFQLPRFPMSNMYSDLNRFIEKLTVKSLHNLEMEVITTGYMGSKTKPRLIMRFSPGSYDLRSIQGFIQNVEVKKIKEIIKNGVLKLTLRPATDLKRRRTLFTVTARDSNGQWYWFSYLFVLLELDE